MYHFNNNQETGQVNACPYYLNFYEMKNEILTDEQLKLCRFTTDELSLLEINIKPSKRIGQSVAAKDMMLSAYRDERWRLYRIIKNNSNSCECHVAMEQLNDIQYRIKMYEAHTGYKPLEPIPEKEHSPIFNL
jgi:hypothetical protein